VWRSIFSANDVVKRNSRWSIGTGNAKPWLASGDNISPTQTCNAQFCSMCVSELIDQTTKTWKGTYLINPARI